MTDIIEAQAQRMERFKSQCEYYLGEVPSETGPWYTTGVEDAAEYIYDPEVVLNRFCLVTAGGEHSYLYPECSTVEECSRLIETKVDPGTYSEGAVAVVDLDTGDTYYPRWETLQWSLVS